MVWLFIFYVVIVLVNLVAIQNHTKVMQPTEYIVRGISKATTVKLNNTKCIPIDSIVESVNDLEKHDNIANDHYPLANLEVMLLQSLYLLIKLALLPGNLLEQIANPNPHRLHSQQGFSIS